MRLPGVVSCPEFAGRGGGALWEVGSYRRAAPAH